MFRYIALVWNDAEQTQAETAMLLARRLQGSGGEWHKCLDQDGVRVFHSGSRIGSSEAVVLEDDAGVILGTLFTAVAAAPADAPRGVTKLTREESAEIARSRGRHLTNSYWGRYVAILRDRSSGTISIVRDPTGHLPCLHAEFRAVHIYFSSMDDCVLLQAIRFSVNLPFVAARIVASYVQNGETGLNEVCEVLPGECVQVAVNTVSKRFYWSAYDVCQSEIIENPARAVVELRQTARACVGAWASCYAGILHHLSGGLDSSIVLACLALTGASARTTCITYYSAGSGDERRYAKSVSRRVGCKLVEAVRDPNVRLEGILRMIRSPAPLLIRNRNVDVDRLEAHVAAQHGASALFGGEGGDQLFYQNPVLPVVSDYLREHGLRPELLGLAHNIATRERLSMWHVLRKGFKPDPWTPWKNMLRHKRCLSDSVIEGMRDNYRFLDQRLLAHMHLPLGKLWHVYMLSFAHQFYSPFMQQDHPEAVEPLTAQPLVELALRIPTYVLANGTYDRPLARAAFSNDLPPDILQRRTKGRIESDIKENLVANAPFVRDLLLDGVLVRERLLDRKRVENVLSGKIADARSCTAEIFDHVTTEAWLRQWSPAPSPARAVGL